VLKAVAVFTRKNQSTITTGDVISLARKHHEY